MKKTKLDKVRFGAAGKLGVFASSLLVTAAAVYLYSPVIQSHADSMNALKNEDVDVSLRIKKVLSLAMSDDEMVLDASLIGFTSGSLDARVRTNSLYGYSLSFSDVDNDTSLVSYEAGSTVTSTFEGQKTSSTFDDNTWGFSLDGTNYSKIPKRSNSQIMKSTTTPSKSTVVIPVHFGAMVSDSLAAGEYVDDVIFTVYANGVDGPEGYTAGSGDSGDGETGTISQITKMQSMTPTNCATSSMHETGTLTDTRDNKTYTVAKLEDGRCWMTQNLGLGGDNAITLTENNSDVERDWTLLPVSQVSQGHNTPYFVVGSESIYGNYYDYHTATAGTEPNYSDGTETHMTTAAHTATSSVCPKGWRLPSKDEAVNLKNKLRENITDASVYTTSPYNFVYAGIRYNGTIYPGNAAYWWTSDIPEGDTAPPTVIISYPDSLDITIYNPNSYSNGNDIYSIRCIAR